jgi:hypothetical protein
MVTDSPVAYYLSMFIIFIIATSFSIAWAKADGTKPISDRFELGYVEDYPVEQNYLEAVVVDEYDELKDLKRQVEIAKLKQQLRDLNNPKPPIKPTQRPKPTKPAIFDDCVSALAGLGTPARKAKAEVQNIFDRNPNIKTVQQFITEYGKR